MDLETIKAANRVSRFQEGEQTSPEMEERLARLSKLSDNDKKILMADAFSRALAIAENLVARPEYDQEKGTLDLSAHGLGKINLRIYHDDGEAGEDGTYGEDDVKPFDGISVDPSGVYIHHRTIGVLNDETVYVNRDGSIPEFYGEIDHRVHATLEYLETLEVIQEQLAHQLIAT